MADAINSVNNYSISIRLCNRLYEIGMQSFKQNGLYVPLFPYRAELKYIEAGRSRAVLLNFERFKFGFGAEKIQGFIINFKEDSSIGVEVLMQPGARICRDWRANPISISYYDGILDNLKARFKKYPSKTVIFKINSTYKIAEETRYDLLLENSTVVRKRS